MNCLDIADPPITIAPMALNIVVHQQRGTVQPWVNAWLDEQRIEAIQTTKEISVLCRPAQDRGNKVYVHRCGWGKFGPQICCSAEVESVENIETPRHWCGLLIQFH